MKKRIMLAINFFVLLVLYFIPNYIFPFDSEFYNSLNLPVYNPDKIVFVIVWPILYIMLSFYFSNLFTAQTTKLSIKLMFLLNYISLAAYQYSFFVINNLFLSFLNCIVILLSICYIFFDTLKEKRKINALLIPFILWNTFALILSINIILIN